MLEFIQIILSIILPVLIGFNIHMNIWYWTEIKYLDDVRKQFEKLSEEYEAELAEKLSEEYEAELAEKLSEEEK